MWNRLTRKRDVYAGSLVAFLGLVLTLKAPDYQIGSLAHMGPGFMPMALGICLIVLGGLIAASRTIVTDEVGENAPCLSLQWRGWLCILAGPVLFILFGNFFGMIPAAFACVFVSALGDRDASLKGVFWLAASVTVLSAALFSYFLQIPMPLIQWRGI